MQLLYQVDLRGEADFPAMGESLALFDDGPDSPETRRDGLALAQRAWHDHLAADTLATELAPAWPTHRQPPVDRALLRLAYHELVSGYAPVKVAINEAIELAKEYGSQQSPAFVNGVLDKMAKTLASQGLIPTSASNPSSLATAVNHGDPWLTDALAKPAGDKPADASSPATRS